MNLVVSDKSTETLKIQVIEGRSSLLERNFVLLCCESSRAPNVTPAWSLKSGSLVIEFTLSFTFMEKPSHSFDSSLCSLHLPAEPNLTSLSVPLSNSVETIDNQYNYQISKLVLNLPSASTATEVGPRLLPKLSVLPQTQILTSNTHRSFGPFRHGRPRQGIAFLLTCMSSELANQ